MATIDWTKSQVRDTALQMQADNVTLEAGQLGFESDTQKGKVGPGAYNSLPYKQDIDIAKADDAWETDQRDDGGDSGSVGFGDLTGTPQDNTSLAQQLETLANTIGTKADAANVPTILDAEFMWDVDHWVMTGVNQFPMDFTIVDLGDGEYKLQAASGTPFTEGKTGFSVALVSTQMRATPEPWQASDGWQYKTVDTSGTQLPSTDNVQVYVRVYQ